VVSSGIVSSWVAMLDNRLLDGVGELRSKRRSAELLRTSQQKE